MIASLQNKRMKRITNILSYLWLLLLMTVTACSDLEEIVVNMQGEEEVELTIQTNIPSLGGSTRTAPTENITSITALAFDSDHELIKVAIEDVTISPSATPSTSGTYTVKVPVRTRRIHFIAKNNGTFDTFSTETDYGKGEDELLQDLTTNELHYWGKLDFANADELKSGGDVTLIRNMAKLVLDTDSNDDYIAGLLNYNVKGTIVPYKDGVLGYQTATNHDLPTDFEIASDGIERTDKDTVHYMFEEFNDTIDGNTDLVYAICKIDSKFYKVALKSPTKYHYIIRNQVYTIKIAGTLDDKLGKDLYKDAVENGSPINDTTKEQVHITFEPDEETTFAIADNEVSMYLREPGKVKVIIPEGITELQIGYSAEYFDEGGLTANVIDGDVIVATNTETKDNIYIKTYNVTDIREFELSIDLKESVTEAIDGLEIQFIGSGELKQSNDKLIVDVLKRDDLTVTPTTVQLKKSAGSEFTVSVTMPSFDNFTGNFELQVTDVNDKFTISPEPQEGKYTVEEGSTTTFTFTLEADGNVDDVYTINFDAISDFHHLTGTTTVTLIDDAVPDQDVYEIWVGDGNAWTGTTNSVEFFGYNKATPEGSFAAGTTPNGFRTDFYDTGANAHISQAMQMGSDDSFTFTIPAGDNRWLTMLVAADGKDGNNTPSINLLKDDKAYTTETAEALANGTYNFGAEDEIGTAGRLIRYELEPGTYTLQGSSAEYLLYYMRVSKARPEMTDVVTDATTSNYTLAWSDGEWNNYSKINDTYFVDDDAKTFTPTLTYKGLTGVKLAASSSLNITTGKYSFSDNQGDGTAITYTEVTSNNNGSDNGDIAIKATVIGNETIIYNAGTYALSGIANVTDTEYKYAAFYDVLRLNAVGFTVKNTIKLGLYYSWNGDANTITEYVDGLPYIIGFRMPYSLPVAINADNDTSTPINFTIDSKWERRESGLGVICNAPNYQLASQQEGNSSNNRVHPRPEWTYKIEWYEVAANTIQPTTTDTDIYFSYGKDNSGNAYITKSPEIATTKSDSEKLALTLDFSSNSENESTHTLNFGNDFYLRATISAEDANKYAGAHVRLQGVFSNNTQGGGNSAIHWTNSRKDGSIEYARNSSDGTQLQFEIKAGQTTYEIHWQFVRDDGSTTTPTQFTYTVDNDAYNITNDSESATIVLNGNGQAVDNPLSIALDFYADEDGDGNVDNQGNSFNNLLLKLTDQTVASKVWLEATVTGDISTYDGKTVVLTGDFPSYNASNSGWAIHWVNSRKNGDIYYYGQDQNGTGLQFTIDANKQEQTYLIEWEFVPSTNNYQGYGDIGFTYNISAYADSPVKYNLSGDTQATIEFTNEPTNNGQIQVAANGNAAANSITMPLLYGANSTEEFTVDVTVPAGVTQINIEAEDFDVAWGDRNSSNTVSGSYNFSPSENPQTTRFKFTLKDGDGSHTDKNSTITFRDNNGRAASATIMVDLSPRNSEPSGVATIWNGAMQLNWDWALNYLSVNRQIATGSRVTLNFTSATGGSFKLHDVNGGANVIVLPNVNYGNNPGIISVNAGQSSYSFDVTNSIEVNSQNINGYINGLKINGEGVMMTSIVVTNNPVIYCNFDNGVKFGDWNNNISTEIVDDPNDQSNKVLKIVVAGNEYNFGQLGMNGDYSESCTYTLSLRFRAESTNGTKTLVFQKTATEGDYPSRLNLTISDYTTANSWKEYKWENVSLSGYADQFVIKFEQVEANATFYIDDLKLVRNNQ